jgi:hypothetical protein
METLRKVQTKDKKILFIGELSQCIEFWDKLNDITVNILIPTKKEIKTFKS